MERGTMAALVVACTSVIVSSVSHHDSGLAIYHGLVLSLPLVCIAFPEVVEAGYRNSFHGRVHGGSEPTPEFIIRIAAWALFVAIVFAHHSIAFARGPA